MSWSVVATWPFALPAVERAAERLAAGSDLCELVVEAVGMVEDDLAVDSVGTGGLANRDGVVQLDAALMEGRSLGIGAVAALEGYPDAIAVARRVLETSPHCLLAGEGAARFAAAAGFERAELTRPEMLEKWRQLRQQLDEDSPGVGHDTVGLIARDGEGHIVVGVSTSGIGLKWPGRIGDSPLVGAGFYADDEWGAVACTGLGEDLMRTMCAAEVMAALRAGLPAQEAAERVIRAAHTRLQRHGGRPGNLALVCLDREGRWGAAANHPGFSAVAASSEMAPAVHDCPSLFPPSRELSLVEIINNVRLPSDTND